jgi:hypothetical protein
LYPVDGTVKSFTIRWSDVRKPREATAGEVEVDGSSAGDALLIYAGSGRTNFAIRKDVCVGDGERRALVYSLVRLPPSVHGFMTEKEINTDDDDDEDGLHSAHPDLGSLTLTLTPCAVEGNAPRRVPESTADLSTGIVNERSKKMGAHCVKLGKRVKKMSTRSAVHYHKTGDPVVRFVWKYRPLGTIAISPDMISIESGLC